MNSPTSTPPRSAWSGTTSKPWPSLQAVGPQFLHRRRRRRRGMWPQIRRSRPPTSSPTPRPPPPSPCPPVGWPPLHRRLQKSPLATASANWIQSPLVRNIHTQLPCAVHRAPRPANYAPVHDVLELLCDQRRIPPRSNDHRRPHDRPCRGPAHPRFPCGAIHQLERPQGAREPKRFSGCWING